MSQQRALFYTLRFDGELVNDIDGNFNVTLRKDKLKEPAYGKDYKGFESNSPVWYQQPEIITDERSILPAWFPALTRHFGTMPVTENWLKINGRATMEFRLVWLKKFTITRWTMSDDIDSRCWDAYSFSPSDLSPSFAKCIKNIEKVLA